MLKNAPIVILDEATASVDPENEAQIQKALSALTAGKTLIVIAHRLSTIVDADQIIVIENGCVAGCGKQERIISRLPAVRKHVESTSGIQRPDGRGGTKKMLQIIKKYLILQERSGNY